MSDPNDTAKDAAQPAGQTTSGGFFSQAPAPENEPALAKEPDTFGSASMSAGSAKGKKIHTNYKRIPVDKFIAENVDEDRRDVWRKFFDALSKTYKEPIMLPADPSQAILMELDGLTMSSKFGMQFPLSSRSLSIANDKDFKLSSTRIGLQKGKILTPERAYVMALLMYTNPAAQKYGVTLTGTEPEKNIILMAIKQVNRENRGGLQIHINNPGMSAVVNHRGDLSLQEIVDELCETDNLKDMLQEYPEIRKDALEAAKDKLGKMEHRKPEDITDDDAIDFLQTNKTDRRSVLQKLVDKNKVPTATADATATASTPGDAAPEDLAKSFGMASGDTTAKEKPVAEPAQKKAKPPVSGITDEMRLRAWNYVVITQDPTQKGLREALDIGVTRARALIDWLEKQGVVGPQPENSFERRKVRVQPKEDFLAAARNSDGTDKYAVAKEMLAKRKDNSGPGAQPA